MIFVPAPRSSASKAAPPPPRERRRRRKPPAECPQSRQTRRLRPRRAHAWRRAKALWTVGEGLELGLRAESAARAWARAAAEALESPEAGLALGVDLAAVEGLALIVFTEDFVSGIDLGKAPSSFWIVLVGVRMQFFRKPPKGAFDVARARLAINAQHLIGITHSPWTPFGFGAGPARPMLFVNVGLGEAPRNPALR